MNPEQHDSYGMIGVNHVNGSETHLVGSDFRHNNFVALRIHRAQRSRTLTRDWWSSREQLIEVWLTESQFVELVGRPNMGDGVPCTLNRVAGIGQPEPPAPEVRKSQGHEDLRESAGHAQQAMREALKVIETGLSEGKIGKRQLEAMAHSLRCQVENFAPNMEFVSQSFDKAMDETINRAGIEMEAIVTQVAMRLGLEEMKSLKVEGPRLLSQAQPEAVAPQAGEKS